MEAEQNEAPGMTAKVQELEAAIRKKQVVADEEWDRYRRAKDAGHDKYLERADKCDRYYRGDQWTAEDKAKLAKQGRPALTINQVLPLVNTILGEQITRRADIRYKPAQDGTEEVAATLTKLVQGVMENEEYDQKESEVFADGVIQERGYFDIRVDFDDNLQGHVSIEVEDPMDIIPDPYGKSYDPDSWQEVSKTRWWSLDEIENTYGPATRRQVEYIGLNDRTQGYDSFQYDRHFSDSDNRWVEPWAEHDSSKRQVRAVRVLERQFWMNDTVYLFVDPATGDSKRVPPHWNREKRRAFASQFRLFLHRKTERRVRWRVVADKIVLHDDWSPYRCFTIVPFFPYFRRGKTLGAVTNLLDPQDQYNKLSSQELHVVNSTANSGWVSEKGSLDNMTEEELAEKGAETGLNIVVKAGRERPEKIQPNTIPTGLDRIGVKSLHNMREISGINEGMLGLTGSEVSGVAIDSKEKRGQVQLQVPLDNLARTRKLVAKRILNLVQSFYTEARVINITRDLPKEGEPGFEQLQINQPTPEGEILNDITVGKYDVVVSSQPSRDTFNDTQFAEALQLRELGIAVPDDRIIEYSNLEKKHALAAEIRELTGRGEMSPEEQAMAAMIQQLELQQMQLNVAELEGKVMKLRAEAQKLMVEAGAIPEELQLELTKLEQEAQLEREGFETRALLALQSSQDALETLRLNHRSKQAQTLLQAAVSERNGQGGQGLRKGAQ